jgi:hypothetical protein
MLLLSLLTLAEIETIAPKITTTANDSGDKRDQSYRNGTRLRCERSTKGRVALVLRGTVCSPGNALELLSLLAATRKTVLQEERSAEPPSC